MADTPSAVLLLRLQSTGSNVNLWGGYLNTAMQTLEQASKGYQSLAVTGDATISWTQYQTGNVGQCARLKLTGALTAAATLTFPGYQNYISIENATTGGYAVTIKCASATGVSISNGDKATLYCDGSDYFNAAGSLFPGAITIAGQLHGLTAGTANTDGVNVTQMAAAIAASVPLGTAGTFLNSLADTTRAFGRDKVTASGLLAATTIAPGGNESLNITTAGYVASGTDTYAITPSPTITAYAAGQAFIVTFTNANTGVATINVNALGAKAITKSGATALERNDITAGSQRLLTYDGTQFQISGVSAPAPGASEGLFMSTNFSNWGLLQ